MASTFCRADAPIGRWQAATMPGISIHVIDVSRGVPTAGMCVELRDASGTMLADALVGAGGALPSPDLANRPMPAGGA